MFFHCDIKGNHLPRGTVCLTYDDGPGATQGEGPGPRTLELGEFLATQHIQATFFVIGRHAERHPEILARLQEWGHLVGNHTYNHPGLVAFAAEGGDVIEEVLSTDRIIRPHVTGDRVFFRPPYGNWRERKQPEGEDEPYSAAADLLNRSACLRHYVGPINWDIVAEDWECWRTGISAQEAAARYCAETERIGRGIVLMHDSSEEEEIRSRNQTMAMTTLLVKLLQERRFRFVRLDQVPEVRTAMQVTQQIALQTPGGSYVARPADGGSALTMTAKEELFGVIVVREGGIALRASNGLLLAAARDNDLARACVAEVGEEAIFHLQDLGPGGFALLARDGRYLSCHGNKLRLSTGCRRASERITLAQTARDNIDE